MKYRLIAAAALLFFAAVSLYPAAVRFSGYTFRAYVVRSTGGIYAEFPGFNKPTLKVRPNEEYSVVIYNPLPVRAAVALSIDGLNSIDGKRTSLRNSRKWMIGPRSSITISGWQTGMTTLRKFVFTDQSSTYAQWKENRDGKNYTRNLGVIGVAWFWNAQELDAALNPPQPFEKETYRSKDDLSRSSGDSYGPRAHAESKAGTGMDDQQQHYVTEVEFYDNAGMYSLNNVLKIYYEFAKDEQTPAPFIDEGNLDGDFADDMYK